MTMPLERISIKLPLRNEDGWRYCVRCDVYRQWDGDHISKWEYFGIAQPHLKLRLCDRHMAEKGKKAGELLINALLANRPDPGTQERERQKDLGKTEV